MDVLNQNPEWSWNMNTQNVGQPRYNSQSILRDLLQSLSESSVNGVNRVASAKNGCQRFMWVLVLSFCLCGFGYQTFEFLSVYYSKPSVVEIQVENDGVVDFPAVTFCNSNRFRKSVFCSYMPERCFGLFHNISLSTPQMNDVIYDLLLKEDYEKKRQLGHSTDILQDCFFDGYPQVKEEECRQMLQYSYDPDFGNCYTIPGKNLKGQLLRAREADFWQPANDLAILFDVEADENMEIRNSPSVILAIHDDSTSPEMLTDGHAYTPGSTHVVSIKKSSIYLLPYPFKTNCTTQAELPWQENNKRTMNSRGCTIGCSHYLQKNKCGFISRNVSFFYEVLSYDPNKVTEDDRKCAENEEKRTQNYCRSICGLSCRNIIFDVAVRSRHLTKKRLGYYSLHSSANRTLEEKLKNLALVKIRFGTLDHKIFRHVPKYESMELFSYLGGYSGVWLGFSLLTVYEMVEILVSAVRFAFLKRSRASQYRNQLTTTKKKLPKKHGIKRRKPHLK